MGGKQKDSLHISLERDGMPLIKTQDSRAWHATVINGFGLAPFCFPTAKFPARLTTYLK